MRTVSTTIEQLELEVQSSATSAVAQLDALASSLGKVKSATKGGVGLTAVAKQLTTLNTALNSISSTNADNLNKMAQGLQALSSCGNLKLSSSVANQISNLGTAVRSLNGTDFSSLGRLADALTPLSTIGKSNLNSFISQLQRLPQAVQGLNGVDIGGLGTQISELVSALSPLSQMGKNNLTSFVTQLGKIPALMQSLKTVNIGGTCVTGSTVGRRFRSSRYANASHFERVCGVSGENPKADYQYKQSVEVERQSVHKLCEPRRKNRYCYRSSKKSGFRIGRIYQ